MTGVTLSSGVDQIVCVLRSQAGLGFVRMCLMIGVSETSSSLEWESVISTQIGIWIMTVGVGVVEWMTAP